MKNIGKIRWGRVILMALTALALTIAMMYICIIHVVNRSFTYNPPTAEEIEEDPTLARYLK